MIVVVIVLGVLAIACSLFQILGLKDFINMKGRKSNKTGENNAEDNSTSSIK